MIKKNKVKDAVNVLRESVEKYQKDASRKKNLLEDAAEAPLYLQITLKKIPNRKNIKMIKVPLPNSTLKDICGTCLIAGDLDKKDKKAEIDPDILHYEGLLKNHGITSISEVITLRQLRTEYKPYEAKQLLLGAYDMFLADKKIAGALPKALGRHFFKKRKYPIQIDLTKKDLKKEIENALSTKVLFLTGHGNSCLLEVANLDMEDSKIIENVMAAVNTLSEKLPGSWDNVMGVYLKTSLSIAIPLYMSYDGANDIKLDDEKEMDIIEDDLSTVPNASVRVYSDGKVECKTSVQNREKDECEDDDISSTEGEELQNSGEKRKRPGKTPKVLLLPECDQIEENKTSLKSRKKSKKEQISMESNETATSIDSKDSQAKGAKKLKQSKKQNTEMKQMVPLSDDLEDSQAVKSPIETKSAKKLEKRTTDKKHVDPILNDSEDNPTVKSALETRKIKNSKKQITSAELAEILPSDSAELQAVTSPVATKKIKGSKKQVTNEKHTKVPPQNFEDDELSNKNKKPNKRKRVDESALPELTENRNNFESPVQVLKKKRIEGNMKKHLAMKEARKNKKKENRPRSK